jgi:hypothetical protein
VLLTSPFAKEIIPIRKEKGGEAFAPITSNLYTSY